MDIRTFALLLIVKGGEIDLIAFRTCYKPSDLILRIPRLYLLDDTLIQNQQTGFITIWGRRANILSENWMTEMLNTNGMARRKAQPGYFLLGTYTRNTQVDFFLVLDIDRYIKL